MAFLNTVIAAYGSSRSQMFFRKRALTNFAIFMGKQLCCSLFNKVARPNACNFIKKTPPTQVFKNWFFYRTPMVPASQLSSCMVIFLRCYFINSFINAIKRHDRRLESYSIFQVTELTNMVNYLPNIIVLWTGKNLSLQFYLKRDPGTGVFL